MNQLKQLLAYLQSLILIAKSNTPTNQGWKIYQTALTLIGKDASPDDQAPDELGCAETVSCVVNKAGFKMPIFLSTMALYQHLLKASGWLQVESPLQGDIIVSPTGLGGKNGITNGHTGIVGMGGLIMSNNSYSGKFESNYSLATWVARYRVNGGYPIYYFRKIS